MTNTTTTFFQDINAKNNLGEQNTLQMISVPKDWIIFITDVKNSTEAIKAGKYKDINITGALCIIAIINSSYYRKIPFVFGGDGVMFLIPNEARSEFEDLMYAVAKFSTEQFSLELRVGIVDIQTIYDAGKVISVGKWKYGNGGQSAVFEGNGIDYAEYLVKGKDEKYLLSKEHVPKHIADFSGFSCPFADIPSAQGNVMALIIKPLSLPLNKVYEELNEIIGDESSHHPLDVDSMKLSAESKNINLNAGLMSGRFTGLKQLWIKVQLRIMAIITKLPSIKKKLNAVIKSKIIPASDYRKFDGSFKIVFRCSDETVTRIVKWLDSNEIIGNFKYGYHLTDRSLMTCLFNGKGDDREMHLIDAADGGYALAALMLKKKLIKEKV